ncbi:MAG: lysophospholipid acyltransferase family protein [Candidatus Puniceispirillaceae bacterium]
MRTSLPIGLSYLCDIHYMMILRSLLFNIFFYAGTVFIAVGLSPLLLLPRPVAIALGRFWGYYTNLCLRIFVGISHEMRGDMHLSRQVIYAAKHQSAWETMTLCWRLNGPVIILKKELSRLPFVGWFMLRSGAIAVDRKAGMKALKSLRKEAISAQKSGRSLQIYPQGTRVQPGQSADYQVGIYAIYDATNLPVIPIALNSGHYWGPRAFLKKPGTIAVSFLPEIEPGLSRKEFMSRLENAIETEMARL